MTKTTYTLENGVLLPRRRLLTSVLGLGAASLGFPALALSKPLKGITLNTSLFTTAYSKLLRPWISEFEEATGATINFDTPSFAVYNQRTDLELSTHGASLDAVNVTFIYSSRWINSGWLQPLDDFISAPQLTPTDYDINDFLPGALAPERGSDGKLYGIPWTAETTLTAASRFDVLRDEGLSFPDTTDALLQAAQQLNRKERASGFVTDNHYGWSFPPFLHAFGGDIFRNAPHDLYPTLDTP